VRVIIPDVANGESVIVGLCVNVLLIDIVGLCVDVLLVDTDFVCVYIDVPDTKGLIVGETVDD